MTVSLAKGAYCRGNDCINACFPEMKWTVINEEMSVP